jgi:hypothetical protein
VSLSASATDPDRDPVSYQWLVRNEPDGANAVLTAPGSATTPATGLTVSGEYVFAVTIHHGVNSVTRNVVLNVHADNEPLFPFDVHNRLPVRMTLPINNTELRCAAIDLASISTVALLGLDRQCPWPETRQKQARSFKLGLSISST